MKNNKWTIIYKIDSLKQHQSVWATSKTEAINKVRNREKHLVEILDAFIQRQTS